MKEPINEAEIHRLFDVSLFLKGVVAVVETICGVLALFVSQQSLVHVVQVITNAELADDPHDFISNYLLHAAQSFSVGAQHFAALYLLSHGVVKLWLIIGLFQKKLWYYPAALIVFNLFVIYQLYLFNYSHSLWLIVVTFLDLIVVGLTVHEYDYLRRSHRFS